MFGINVQRWTRGEYRSARINEWRRRDEHVLDFLAAQHVPVDRCVCYVAEIAYKCQEVVILMKIYGTFVTCFASYQGKSREIIDFNPFMLYLSYFT